jgi:hypothetical protein
LAHQVQIDHNDEPITTQLKAWKNNLATKQALITLLGSEASFHRFKTATMSIARLLGQLLRERKAASKPMRKVYFENAIGYLQRADSFRALSQTTKIMFDRLQEFAINKESGNTKTSFADRFRFFRKNTPRHLVEKLGNLE